ncbi:hypothetical protein VTO73DRAFT_4898 [Trametes versicolor]
MALPERHFTRQFDDTLLEDTGPATLHETLSDLQPRFFIPRLADKPQNPIMDTLRLMNNAQYVRPANTVSLSIPLELGLLSEDVARFAAEKHAHFDDIWQRAAVQRHGHKKQVLSWDALRPSHNANVLPSPFLSEQASDVFASARYYVRPPLQDPRAHLVYARVSELFESLILTVSGTSSHLHIWDPGSQTFVLRNLHGKEQGHMVIVGKDEVVSASLLQRFLTIGNLMRRLELLAESRETKHATPISHAFAHSLSSILAYLRQLAEAIPMESHTAAGEDARLTALWVQYEDMENILRALAALCGRDEDVSPLDYIPVPSSPSALLSAIYTHLSDHYERSSPRIVTAVLAFMLTTTSRNYFQSLSASIGYNTPGSRARAVPSRSALRLDEADRAIGGGAPLDDTIFEEQEVDDGVPEFISPDVAEVLSRARRSLVLLRAADSGHPLLTSTHMHREVEWIWTEEQIENMTDEQAFDGASLSLSKTQREEQSDGPSRRANVLAAFKVFDLVPGEPLPTADTNSTTGPAPGLLSGAHGTVALCAFLSAFPATLPSATPTLAHLTARILRPLLTHASALSGALVSRVLSPETPLHLRAHLVLLRGYLLLTAHAFKARLQDALFSDAEDVYSPVVGSRMYAAREARTRTRTESGRSKSRSRAPSGKTETDKQGPGRRAVGLSPALTVGDRWPPGGTDLNFHLRTVIVDSLEDGRTYDEQHDDEEQAWAQRKIVEEAEWRLGFAIRDLPAGTGKEKWLNPLSIEALDFLYMHYQPPHPLDIVITPSILSKYHRIFAFNLRLMRVENVVRTLFRLTRHAAAPLFPTLTPANKRLLHFRAVAHAFVMGLSAYVYDVAIGSNVDAFLARLPAARQPPSAPHIIPTSSSGDTLRQSAFGRPPHGDDDEDAAFADVFSLAEHHSRVLDDVLSACLLRSGQKAVGDLLRQCMELVLELGVLAGELKDGHAEEYEAALALEEVWGRFRAKMTMFVKVLKALVEREADSSGLVLSEIPLHMMQGHRRVSGTTANLHQLLLRLNMSDWWTKSDSARTT